jgi:hypothetical protein
MRFLPNIVKRRVVGERGVDRVADFQKCVANFRFDVEFFSVCKITEIPIVIK